MSDLPNPINRYEKYLNAIATGNSDDLPTPTTREEVFLDYIAKNGGGGDIPTKTSDLINDSGFITNLVNNLLNYYLKSETYSKTEVDSLLQAITTLDVQAVSQLPTTNISTTTIYLVPKQDPQVPDIKDEYINLDGTTSGWELIGNTQIDLSNYVTTSDLTTALQSYATKTYVDGLIGDLSSATTTDKSSCVGAINEVNTKANTYGIYTVSNATDIKDFFLKLAAAVDNDLSNKPDYVLYNIIGYYEKVDLFYGVIVRTDIHNYLFTFIRSFGSKMYCGNADITNSNIYIYEYSGTLVS